jgi:hypothetical protein
MVVPCLDKDHTSLRKNKPFTMILYQGSKTTSKEFAHNVHIAWALFRGLNEDDTKFVTFLNLDKIVFKVFVQKNSWESGHQVVFNFETYLQERGMLASIPTYHVS